MIAPYSSGPYGPNYLPGRVRHSHPPGMEHDLQLWVNHAKTDELSPFTAAVETDVTMNAGLERITTVPSAAYGSVTRGTTAPNRLRRVDAWIAAHWADRLTCLPDPLIVDLGFGASPITTVQMAAYLAAKTRPQGAARPRVVGLEIDPARVAAALPAADPPYVTFSVGGFELAGLCPVLVRAMNVLRQYDETEVSPAWAAMRSNLAPGGMLVEGTCDEQGRIASWIVVNTAGPVSLTLSARLKTLDSPAVLAQRLPKALIHRNVPGEGIYDLLTALDRAWRSCAPHSVFGPRGRWCRAVAEIRGAGWPVIGGPSRWRHGEVTVPWNSVAPRSVQPVEVTR